MKLDYSPVVVTTAHRGVFFGWYAGDLEAKTVRLTDAQMCVYWSAAIGGVLGLAVTGPDGACRIGPPAPAITLQDVTAIIEVKDEAVKAWQARPWS